MSNLIPYLSGLLFGGGLVVGGMTRPDKVIGFLDITGAWDPSLAFVMGGAVVVMAIAWMVGNRQGLAANGECIPCMPDTTIDARLLGGAAIFGAGWGLAGFCPGPGIVASTTGAAQPLVFMAALIAGISGVQFFERRRAEPQRSHAQELHPATADR